MDRPFSLRQGFVVIALLSLVCTMLFLDVRTLPGDTVRIDVFDVGQGDSMFITGTEGQQILIDGGPDLSVLRQLSRRPPFFDRTIDLLILSHPNLDHFFAFPEILRRYRVQAVMLTGGQYDIARYDELLALLEQKHIPLIVPAPAVDVDLGGGLLLDLVWPPPVFFGKAMEDDVNNSSIVLRLLYGADSMLFTGDMEVAEEEDVLASGADVRADILKIAHHGSRSSTSTGFLLAVAPSR